MGQELQTFLRGLHLDFIQGLSKVELLLQKRVRGLGAGWERDRTMVAPMHTLLGYWTTLLLETWHFFLKLSLEKIQNPPQAGINFTQLRSV